MAGAGFSSADAPGAAPAADRSPHLLLVPDTADGRAALSTTDARVVARYDEFTLAEAAGGDERRLREAGADRRDDMREVGLPDAEVDPLFDRASLAAKTAPERAEVLALAQFVGPVKDAWVDRLRATGARVVQYVAENGYLVHARGVAVARLAALVGAYPALRAVTPVAAGDKADASLSTSGARAVAVQTVAGSPGEGARRSARAAGERLAQPFRVGELSTQFLRLEGAEVAALAADPGVVAMTAWSAPKLLDERGAQIVAGNLSGGAPSGAGYLAWLTGEGFGSSTFNFAIDVTDSGLDNGNFGTPDHQDFYVNGVKPGTDRVRYAANYTQDPDARDCVGHGTNVASIAAGFGTAAQQDSLGFKYGMGVAPRAQVGASKVFDCTFEFSTTRTYRDIAAAAYQNLARISNNSWGINRLGAYGPEAQVYDSIVRDAQPSVGDNQEMVEVFAAGNDGANGGAGVGYRSIDSPGTAKNVITVGASEGVRPIGGSDGCTLSDAEANHAGDVLGISSRGPTHDGRLKPDLVAPGSHITGAAPQHDSYNGLSVCNEAFPATNPFHSLSSGTSQAAPHVSGAAALIRDWFTREKGLPPPSPAMTKAILTNAASDLAGRTNGKGDVVTAGPNNDQGYGRVNVGAALDSTQRVYHDQRSADLIDQTGESSSGSYRVADATRPLKVTLAWTDPPGPTGGNAFVNNLDLVVEAGGRTYKGNVFGDGVSVGGGTADSRNNLESVHLPAGTTGRFQVKVVGTNIAGDGLPGNSDGQDQDFALVVSNAVEAPNSPVLVHERTQVDDGTDGDGDRALEPGEGFTIDETVRNAGDATATGPVAGVLSAGSGLTVLQAAAQWPSIADGAAQPSSTDPRAQVSSGVPCGADVSGTLALTSTGDTHDIPLTMPTGTVQTATVNSRSHSPGLFIPDNSSAGATSTITVTRPGRIRDLNVRIGAILYPWMGDLRIDLVGPDGTTVTLADHPGGPDNQGDNMVGTVFDDEATTNIGSAAAPYSGRFKPQHDQLSRFDGKPRQGVWKLRVRDLVGGDNGTVAGWGTEISGAACDFGPAPDTAIGSGPSATTTERSARFTFSGSGSGAGGGFECRLDGALFSACASGQAYSGLAVGTHTVAIRAVDSTGNVDASPATHTWTVRPSAVPPRPPVGPAPPGPPTRPPVTPPAQPADTTAPHYALVPTTHSWRDALGRRLKLVAGCASACRVRAKLGLSRAVARRLDLKRTLGSASVRLTRAGAKFVAIRLSAQGRRAARRGAPLKARLSVTLSAGTTRVKLSPTISLRTGGALSRLARRSFRLAGACSEACSAESQIAVGAREARRLGLSASGGALMAAKGSSARSDRRFTLSLRAARPYRRALARVTRLNANLTSLVQGTSGPTAKATGRLKLRR